MKRKLKDFVDFIPGINQSRADVYSNNKYFDFYDQFSFESDYKHNNDYIRDDRKEILINNKALSEGDVVISNSLQLATIIRKQNIGKILSLNFTKVEFNNKELNKKYFLYLFNSNKDIKIQKEKELQGTGPSRRLTLRSLSEIIIPVIALEEQIKIGETYIASLKLQSDLIRYSELVGNLTNFILEEKLKEEK